MKPKTIEERAQAYYNKMFDEKLVHLMDVAEGEKRPNKRERASGICDKERAHERLLYQPYRVYQDPICYVWLSYVPAAQVKVTLDKYGDVKTASLQVQEGSEPWTDAPYQDAELVERYARLAADYEEDEDEEWYSGLVT